MSWSDPSTDIVASIADFMAMAKERHEEYRRNGAPRLVVPQSLVDTAGWTQDDLDAFWLEVAP